MSNVEKIVDFLKKINRTEKIFISVKNRNWKDYYIKDQSQLIDLLQKIDFENADVYFSAFKFNDSKRKEENVMLATDLFVFDIDKKQHEELSEKEKEILVNDLKKIAYYVLCSGRGIQFAIKTNTQIEFENRTEMKDFYKKLARIFNAKIKTLLENVEIDSNALKLTQVMRLAYTINQKNKRETCVVFYQENILDAEELKEFVNRFKKEEENEKHVINITDDFVNEIVFTTAQFYKKGERHNTILGLAAYLRKKTDLNEEEVKKIVEKIVEIANDEEKEDRIRAVEDTFKKDVNEIAYTTFLRNELIEKLNTIINKHTVLKSKFVYALARTTNKKTFIMLDNKKKETKIVEIKNTDEGSFVIAEKTVILATINFIKKYIIIDKNDSVTKFDVEIRSKDFSSKLEQVTTDAIIEFLQKNSLDASRKDVLRRVLNVLAEKSKETEIIYKNYSINLNFDDINKIERVRKNNIKITDETLENAIKYIENIKERELAILLATHTVISTLREKNIKIIMPTLALVGEKGLGKSTLAEFFTKTAFLNDVETQDTLNSIFRFINAFSRDYTTILLDDVNKFNKDLYHIIKSYATSNRLKIKRGKSNLEIEEYELTNAMILTANTFVFNDDALRDRFIVINVSDYTFKDMESALRCNFDKNVYGWGFVLAHKVNEIFNETEFENEKIEKIVEIIEKHNFSHRRAEIVAQYLVVAKKVSEILKLNFDEEKFTKLFETVQTDEEKQTAVEIVLYAINNNMYTFYNNKYYITSLDYKKLQGELRIKISFRDLASILNKKIKQITKNKIRAIDVSEYYDEYYEFGDGEVIEI